ncbi:hypothetical protein EFA69_06630 [Rufibacter immobilis]|uniref:Uncharacterized protein n=1 Tax=Rufibacter immobilis TaxID=1348778 RepID=A0A3M9MZH2_9BACT|nr:hypothetical protein EFA69_06630 [Rufibacter immobilis]
MNKQYALIPEEYITPELALNFLIVSDFSNNHVIESHQIKDASGQESTVLNKWITLRWVESDTQGFSPEQVSIIQGCRDRFNQEHQIQIDFEVIGDNDWAIDSSIFLTH